MAYLIGVAHRAQVMIARDAGFVAFSHGREAAVRRLSIGDRVVYYSPKSDFEGTPVRAFTALATVTGDAPKSRDFGMGKEGWIRDADFAEVRETPVKQLLDDLGFVTNKTHWGMAFRQGKFTIEESDFNRIAEVMGVSL